MRGSSFKRHLSALAVVATALSPLAAKSSAAAELKPLYYESFKDGKIDGPVGKAGPYLQVPAPGKIDFDRGTLAFFTKTDKVPAIEEWGILAGVFPVGNTGYWGMGMGFDTRKADFMFSFYDAGLYAPPLKLGSYLDGWKAGEWHHLAAVWDRHQGMKVYQDGKLVASNWGEHHWEWNVFPETLFVSGPADEVYTFAEPLSDAQIAQLARGEKPTGDPLPSVPDVVTQAADLKQMGWTGAALANLPVVEPGKPQTLTFARVMHVVDAKRPIAQLTEGYPGDIWPLLQYGASIRGRHADLMLAPGESFDHLRVAVYRPFSGAFVHADGSPLAAVSADQPSIWHRKLDRPVQEKHLGLNREYGRLGQIDLYRVDPLRKVAARELEIYSFAKADSLPDNEPGQALLAQTPVRYQQFALATRQSVAAWKLPAPAFGGFQATTELPKDAKAYDGVVVTLVAEGMSAPTPVRITIKEPVHGLRDWLVGDAILQPRGSGPQNFSIFLKGRPVINMPPLQKKKYWKDGIYLDEMLPIPSVPFGIKVEAANPVTWTMGDKGTSVAFHTVDMQKALPVATDDQVEFMREAYAQMMEGHAYGHPRMVVPTLWLAKFAPTRMEFRQMYERMSRPQWFVGMNTPPYTYTLPKNTTGAPEWAFWQMQALREHQRLLYWEVDNLLLPNGELGGVWNDDTDHVENVIDHVLCMDDSGKLNKALHVFWEGLPYHLEEGVGKYVQDSLHYYEEGMGVLSMRMLVDYGDPVAFNNTLAAASHVPHWAEKKNGKWVMKTIFIGPNANWEERDFNVLDRNIPPTEVLVPGGYLYWYNRFPTTTEYFNNLPGGGGLFLDEAVDRMNGLAAARQNYEKSLVQPIGRYGAMYHNTWIDEIGVSDAVRKAHAVPFQTPGPIANYEGMNDTDLHWFRYKTTGDIRYLTESYKRVWEWFQRMDWIVTEAKPSLDRNPLPRYSLIRARMGSLATHRGGTGADTLRWPEHGITYTKGADDVAALVYDNLDTRLGARFYAFTEKPHDMQIRVWRLDPGTYQVTLAHDVNDDGQPEGAIMQKQMMLERGSFVDLTLPAHEPVIFTATPIDTHPMNYERPDPAVSLDTCEYVYGEHLVVHVYNLGSKPVENLTVRVRDGRSGRIVAEGEQVIKRIEAPLDFKPKQVGVEFKNINANTYEQIIVEIDPDHKIDDLNPFNNKVVLDHKTPFWEQ